MDILNRNGEGKPRFGVCLGSSLLFALLGGLLSCSGKAPVAESPAPEARVSSRDAEGTSTTPAGTKSNSALALSRVIAEVLDGRSSDDAKIRARYDLQAKRFIELRSGKLKGHARETLFKECASADAAAEQGAFCAAVQTLAPRKHASRNSHHAQKARAQAEIRAALYAANLQSLASRREPEIVGAMRKVEDPRRLDRVISLAVSEKDCPSTALLTALGLKSEEEFSDPAAIDRAISLYKRSLECSKDNSSMKAGYRLGLIHIWKGRFTDAEAVFDRIVDEPEAFDYRARSLYWRSYVAKMNGKEEVAQSFRAKLVKEYPLSLHAILSDPAAGDFRGDPNADPEVAYRSKAKDELNDVVRIAEAVQAQGKAEYSDEILNPYATRVQEAEPAFQLYYSVLLKRSGEVFKKFQILSNLMKQYPEYITKPALEMFYPLRSFDTIKAHEEKADPFLVIALIRQESAFNVRAKSRVGAMGLMQLMPATARKFARVNRKYLFDPEVNVRVGVAYFSMLVDRFGGDAELALAAYNAGADRVDDWKKRYPVENRLLFLDLIPFKETREYVAAIARNYHWYSHIYGKTDRALAAEASGRRATLNVLKQARF